MVANIATTIHFNTIKKYSEHYKNIDTATAAFYMGTLSIPILLVLVQFENPAAFNLLNRSNGFYMLFTLCLSSGILLTFSQNLCTVLNSPIITSITGNTKDVFGTLASILLLDDLVPTFGLIVGLVLSMAGAFIYSYPKLVELSKNKT